MKKTFYYILFSFGSFLQGQTIIRQNFIIDVLGYDEAKLRLVSGWNPSKPINPAIFNGGNLKAWYAQHSRRPAILQGTFHTQQITINTKGYKNLSVNTGLSVQELDILTKDKGPVSTSPYFSVIFYDPERPEFADIRYLQTLSRFKYATFQIASTFNALEGGRGENLADIKAGPRYVVDMVKGPAQGEEAAIACAGATIFRKYFLTPVNLLARLYPKIRMSEGDGFASIDGQSLNGIKAKKTTVTDEDIPKIAVGLHQDIVVTSGYGERGVTGTQKQMPVVLKEDGITVDVNATQIVSQVFTAAFNTSGERKKGPLHPEIANLSRRLLQGSYEGTLKAAYYTGKPKVILTLMGGGVFYNDMDWIFGALNRESIKKFIKENGLQVAIIYRPEKRKTPFQAVRTKDIDTQFLLNILKFSDDINGTNLANNLEVKTNVTKYVEACYENKEPGIIATYAKKLQKHFSQVQEQPELMKSLIDLQRAFTQLQRSLQAV